MSTCQRIFIPGNTHFGFDTIVIMIYSATEKILYQIWGGVVHIAAVCGSKAKFNFISKVSDGAAKVQQQRRMSDSA